jgi:phenylpyruvate tautomerase PptA (4-oxalocrotonate tautomerase family)
MPMVRIDTTDEWTQEEVLRAGEVIYQVLMDVFSVPENDKFQIVNRHPKGGLNVAPNFHGNAYSEKILIIQIFLNKGRTVELKKQFYRSLMSRLVETVDCRADDVVINLVEVTKENWSFGQGLAQLAD